MNLFLPVDWKVSCTAGLVATHVLQLLELLAEPEVAVGRHDPVVLPKVLQLHRSRCLDDRVGKTHLETEIVIILQCLLHSMYVIP